MNVKLYGVGVGPGDPELLTLKAVRIINESQVIVVPGEMVEESIAYKIAVSNIVNPKEKVFIAVSMPMTKDINLLEEKHKKAALEIIEFLKQGKNVAFLTLGDPTVYSTYIYVHKIVNDMGYETEIISGITSFCAVSAVLNQGLVEKNQVLHVIPSSYNIEDSIKLPGTKVLMKAGKKLPQVKEKIRALNSSIMMVENCGMDTQKIYRNIDEINEEAGYYSLIIVKEQEGSGE